MAARATSAFYHFTLILHLFLLINYNYGERFGDEPGTLFINRAGDSSRTRRAMVINSEDNYVGDSETSFLRKRREAADHSNTDPAATSQNTSEPNIITKVNLLNDSHQQLMVHWVGERSDIIICLARDSTSGSRGTGYSINPSAVYISYDYGNTFENKTEHFKISDNPVRYASLDKFYNHPKFNTHCVFADNANKIIFITNDNGKHITAVNLTFHPSEITFYEDNPNYFVALDKIDPERPLRITHDMGRTWSEVEKYVKAFFWSSLHPKSIIIQRASIDSHNVIETDLMIGQKFEKNLKRIISNVEDFQIKGDYMFATKKSITRDSNKNSTLDTLEFFVSYKNQPFVLAQFDSKLERIAYHISDVSHNRIFVAVAHGETHINLYVSDVIDDKRARFKLSLDRILTFFPNCTWKETWLSEVADEAFTDLYKVEGLKGIYIASQLIALPAQVTVDPEHLVSVITYDHGATWNKIKAPLNVHEKKELINNGSAHEWSLHLSQRFSQLYPVTRSVSIMSSKSAPGIILATGVMGPNMKGHPGFYVSRDAGFTWKLVLKDYYFFNMGDHGGILIAVKYFKSRGETRDITYSTDEGKTWRTHKFNQEVLRIYGLMTEPGENTTVFTMFGSNPVQHKWVIIKVDLQNVFERNCTVDDFKFWSPSRPDEQCILGRKEVYQRRAANINCYTGMDYDRPVTRESCPCDYQDYECDFGFIRSKTGQNSIHCIRDPLNTKYDPYLIPSDCPPGSFYNRTKGYRKIADDECSGGVARKFDPDEIPCPIVEPSEFLLVAQREHISRIDLRSQSIETLPVRGLKNVIAIEYDLRNNCLYWADIVNDTIGRQCFRDGTSYPEILVETDLSSIEGMALDWVSNVLYFVDGVKMRIQIIRTDLTIAGRMRKTILGSNNLQKPRGIAVHPMRGYMFWTDWAPGNASVSRANLDGTNVKRLFTKGTVEWPNGITIDYNAGRIYWVDAREDYIAYSDFDGHGFRKVIQDDDRVSHPFAVAVFKNNIYWDDWKQSTIFAADKDHGMIVSMKAGILTGLMDLKVFAHSVQNGTNACVNSTCSHLCLGTPENSHVCLCPDGMEMTNGKCLCPGGSQPYANSTCPQVASTCAHNQFSCHNGVCIPEIWMCDGDNDCGDESDEFLCKRTTCAPNNFECDEDKCIPRFWVCDLDRDCRDGKDELNCTYQNCTDSKFQCDNGRCIPPRFYCDGDDDCHDNSDERNCSKPSAPATCKSDELTCVSDHACIPKNWQCDGERDCEDGTDEKGCNMTTCLDWQFSCNSADPHQCIYGTWACDGERDCHDGSDEVNCSHPTAEPPLPPLLPSNSCIDWMFRCNNSRCVPYWWKCDNVDDCKDGSDEVGCGIIDSGITESPVTETSKQPFVCQPHEFLCYDGSCIPNSWHCDGASDCQNGEDEHNCAHTPPCTGDLFKCVTDGNCIPSSSICNGVEDCPDRSDEANCHKDLHPRPPGSSSCGMDYFPCDRCYHSNVYCDGKYYITRLDVNVRKSNSTSLAVSWDIPHATNTTFEYLPSIAKVENGSKWRNASNWIDDDMYYFNDLQPYTSYNATVYVKIKGQESAFAPFKYWVINTGEGVPSKPWNVTAIQLNGTRIKVSWRSPQHPNGVIQSYELSMNAPNFPDTRVLVRTSYVFNRPFEAGHTYSFYVVAQNREFKSEPSETVSVTFNGTANIDDIEDLRVIKTTNNSVQLAWKALKSVDCYHVTPRAPATYPAYPTSITEKNEFTVPNLAPGISYIFEVNAMKKPYIGNIVSIKATTDGVALPIVPNFSADSRKIDGTTVKLSWDPPKNPKKLKWQYAIHYALNIHDLFKEFKLLTTNHTASIKDLHACESYIFAVGLRGDYGIGPLTSPTTVFTYRNIRAPPKHLTVTQSGEVDKIIVSWTASCIMIGDDPINYTISVVELVSNKTSTITLPPTNETALKHTFRDIKYGEKYKITVATDVEGAKSTEPVIYIAPPLPPPHQFGIVPAMGGFILFWEQDEMPHYLKNTTNYFYELLVNENLPVVNETTARVYKVPHSRYIFNDTKANMVYSFAVRLATVDGYRSVLSEVESARTPSAWPVTMNASSLLSIAIPICLLIIALGAGMTYFFVRHRRLSNSFTQFANSHYDTRRGQATFPGTADALDEEDSPVIRGFSDDEPLVIA